eukprot:CAMPEP_0117622968 /NCGR_PEP_ID=MMETSP0784-20121206/88410_1 /TAXON_ID=39447 /ORGANISM="" /LENGTH=332 /DNA_ID=CAMNT_0005426915 /DNA_START=59 /DNA_END=1057 /DNA_ORIENTATION=-
MNCIQSICRPRAHAEAKENEMKARLKVLRVQLEESRKVLKDEQERCMKWEKASETKRRQVLQLEAQVEIQRKQPEAALTCRTLPWFDWWFGTREALIKTHLQEVQDALSDARAAVEKQQQRRLKLEEDAEAEQRRVKELEAQLQRAKSEPQRAFEGQQHPRFPNFGTSTSQRSLSFLRAQTPARQREMKSQIEDILKALEETAQETSWHRERFGTIQEEAETNESRSKELLAELDETRLNLFGHTPSKLRGIFRTKTPAQQRDLKVQLQQCLKELGHAQSEVVKERNCTEDCEQQLERVRRKSSELQSQASKTQVSSSRPFAFGAPRELSRA